MKKVNKFLMIFCVALTLGVLPTVNAQTIPYYINLNDVEMTKEEYDKLLKNNDMDTVATLTEEGLNDLLKVSNNFTESTAYVKYEEKLDYKGDVVEVRQTNVSKNEYENFNPNISLYTSCGSGCWQTTYKKLTIRVGGGASTVWQVYVVNEWLKMPATRSNDVIAFRTLSNFVGSVKLASASQVADGKITSHVNNAVKCSEGLGVVIPLSTTAKSNLRLSMNATFFSPDYSTLTAFGSYQHAQSSVSLTDAKNFTISADGLGHVIKFKSSTISSKYDNMTGVTGSNRDTSDNPRN